ncbi:MAG: ABC transporter ATP-binding protein [Planctomycetes bacterium]|nr:ABC transporter ATP-binding protein [Planctomycetota bacterium]
MLELHGISKRWNDFSVREIELRIEEGEYFVLLGPSGAGKSLLLELIAGFHTPDTGRIALNGRDVTDLAPERRRMGFVYQDNMLFPHRSVRGNIAYGPRLRGLPGPAVEETVRRLAAMLRIEGLLRRRPDTLSAGQKQRVGIARALAARPRALLMDEPLASLDPPAQRSLRGELKRVHAETGVTVLHVTHDQREAAELGRRIGVMREGRIVQVGEPGAIFETPRDHFVAEFTGARNIYTATARPDGDLTEVRCGAVRLISATPLSGPVRAVIRPENVLISAEPVRASATNQIPVEVVSVERQGRLLAVTGRRDGLEISAIITPRSLDELGIEKGTLAYFSFKASSVHLMRIEDDEHD